MSDHGVVLLRQNKGSQKQWTSARTCFQNEIMPILIPLAMNNPNPPPILPGRQLNVAITIATKGPDSKSEKQIVVVPVPNLLQRFIRIPGEKDFCLVLLEDVIADNVELLCPVSHITGVSYFSIIRDADVGIQEDEAADLLEIIEQAIIERRRRSATRLEISSTTDMRQKFLELIEREIQASSADKPGLIMAKVNSLQDKKICQALYRASQAGIKVLLNVHGICCGQYSVELVKLQELSKNQGLKVVIDDPVRRWKLNPMDLKSRLSWVEYSKAKDEMFKYSDIKQAPW